MIKSVTYRVLTDEEAIWATLRKNPHTLGTIASLRKGDTLTIEYPITMTVDVELAKQIAKEYLDENSSN